MVYFHKLKNSNFDLSNCIGTHSADKVVTYKEVENKPVNLGIYYPENYKKGEKYPVFVFVHGGGWASHKVFADQTCWSGDYLGFLARYYANRGFVSVSIDYRLMQFEGQQDGFSLIDLYEDCLDAVKYLTANAECLGLDFSRSVILGESAGGYLAGALATLCYKEKPVFKKNILVNAILDLFDSRWAQRTVKNSNHPCLLGKTADEIAKFLSPVHQIGDNTNPTILIHGTADEVVHPRHSQAFYDEMRLHGKLSEIHWIDNTDHAFLLAEYMIEKGKSLSACEIAIDIINDFLKEL